MTSLTATHTHKWSHSGSRGRGCGPRACSPLPETAQPPVAQGQAVRAVLTILPDLPPLSHPLCTLTLRGQGSQGHPWPRPLQAEEVWPAVLQFSNYRTLHTALTQPVTDRAAARCPGVGGTCCLASPPTEGASKGPPIQGPRACLESSPKQAPPPPGLSYSLTRGQSQVPQGPLARGRVRPQPRLPSHALLHSAGKALTLPAAPGHPCHPDPPGSPRPERCSALRVRAGHRLPSDALAAGFQVLSPPHVVSLRERASAATSHA